MSEPLSAFQRTLPHHKPQPSRPSQPSTGRPRPAGRTPRQASPPALDPVLEKPALDSLSSFDEQADLSLIFDTDFFPRAASRAPGFSSYDEAEAVRSCLPVQSLDLVPTILSRSGCPVMLSARVWLDKMLRTPSAGWYDTVGTLGALGAELAAIAHLDRADGSGQKYFAFVRDLWAIHEDEDQKVWHASYLKVDDKAGLDDPIGRGFFTGGGPSWPVDSHVTLLAKAVDARGEFFVKSYPTAVTCSNSDN